MTYPVAPLTKEEGERLRVLLHKVNYEKLKLTPEEEQELRTLVAKDKPKEAKTADYATLLFLGAVVLGFCLLVWSLDTQK